MAKLYLVRHARPAAGWGEDADPGLDGTGEEQAEATALELSQSLDRLQIYTSPLRRCRETALPLERLWQRSASVLEPVAELPSPLLDLKERQEWLRQAMGGTWRDLCDSAPPGSPDYLAWRQTLLRTLAGLPDCVIFTHFIAINVAVAAAHAREEVVCFQPDHASITCVEIEDGIVRVIELGREAKTSILTR
jgi:broad specificity phosphatase PhoE